MTPSAVAGIILAAGRASRMGGEKVFLTVGGRSLFIRAVTAALEGGCRPVRAVIRPDHAEDAVRELEQLRRQFSGGSDPAPSTGVQICPNPDYRQGLSTSVRTGLDGLAGQAAGALFLLADQPLVDARVVRALLEAFAEDPTRIVQPMYGEQPGNPVLIPECLWEELLAVQGDQGGRPLLRRHSGRLRQVPFDDPSPAEDLDTPEALERIRRLAGDGVSSPPPGERSGPADGRESV